MWSTKALRYIFTPKGNCRDACNSYKPPSCGDFYTIWLANKTHRITFKAGLRAFYPKKELAREQQWQGACFLAQLRAHTHVFASACVTLLALPQRLPTFVTLQIALTIHSFNFLINSTRKLISFLLQLISAWSPQTLRASEILLKSFRRQLGEVAAAKCPLSNCTGVPAILA